MHTLNYKQKIKRGEHCTQARLTSSVQSSLFAKIDRFISGFQSPEVVSKEVLARTELAESAREGNLIPNQHRLVFAGRWAAMSVLLLVQSSWRAQ